MDTHYSIEQLTEFLDSDDAPPHPLTRKQIRMMVVDHATAAATAAADKKVEAAEKRAEVMEKKTEAMEKKLEGLRLVMRAMHAIHAHEIMAERRIMSTLSCKTAARYY